MEAPANPRVSRWSDAPSGQGSVPSVTQDTDNGEKRPPSAAPEPPFKKSRLDAASTQGANTANSGYAGDAASGFGGNSEGLTVLNGGRSAAVGHGYGASSADQGFGAAPAFSGERNYGSFAPGSARGSGTGALFFKTKLCTKFKLGSCTFNERCHFAHGVEELRKPPPGWEEMVKQGGGAFNMGAGGRSSEPPRKSNKPCRFFLEGHCPYGDRCTFSHGNEDTQRETAPTMDPSSTANTPGRSNYKTRLCTRWEKGELCIYGDKCHFAHGQAELRTYSGGPNYSNTGVTGPNMYADPSMMNVPPPMAAPYGGVQNYGSTSVPPPVTNYGSTGVPPPASNYGSTGVPPAASNYGSTGVPPPSSSANLNPYPIAGANVNTYGTQQDATNGYSTNYTYWNPENKWDGINPAVQAPASNLPTQGYSQTNQMPWMPTYAVDGGYPKTDNSAATYYNPDLSQQHQPQPPQQQNLTYYGSAPTYQDANQSVNPAYVQDVAQNGDGNTYYNANYANQQPGYTGTYNTV